MFALRRIRSQMYFGVIMLLIIVTVLSAASLQGVMKFRKLTKGIRERSLELPEAAQLGQKVSELRSDLWNLNHVDHRDFAPHLDFHSVDRADFKQRIHSVEDAFERYRIQLDKSQPKDPRIADKRAELEFVEDFDRRLDKILGIVDDNWVLNQDEMFDKLEVELADLQELAAEIPVFMNNRMEDAAVFFRAASCGGWRLGVLCSTALLALPE